MLFKDINKCRFKNPNFIYDEACLDIFNTFNEAVSVMGQYSECHKCDFQNLTTLNPSKSDSVLVNTRYPLELFYVVDGKHCR